MANLSPDLIMFITFGAIVLLIFGAAMVYRDVVIRSREKIRARINGLELPPTIEELRLEQPEPENLSGLDRRYNTLVAQTGLGVSAVVAFLIQVLVGVLLGGAVFLWRDNLLAAIVSGAIGLFLPLIIYLYLRARRRYLLHQQLPGALELMARALRAGETVDQSIHLVGESVRDPLGREFRRCSRQLQMGLSLAAGVHAMSRRVGLMEIRILAAALTVQRMTGGNLSLTLERMAACVRDRQSYRRQFRAATAGGRMATILAFVCVPAYLAFLVFQQYDYAQPFFTDPLGWWVLAFVFGLQLIGLIWIISILRTDY
jgi:tight adherence protein B